MEGEGGKKRGVYGEKEEDGGGRGRGGWRLLEEAGTSRRPLINRN